MWCSPTRWVRAKYPGADKDFSFCLAIGNTKAEKPHSTTCLMRIVHLSTTDSGGGAFRAAFRLHTGLRRLGHDSKMLVAKKGSSDENVNAVRPADDFFSRTRRK